MRYESIADIYSANEKIREKFLATLSTISPNEATALPEGEKWSIQQIAEHVSMVDNGAARICAKLLGAAKAAGVPSNGFALSTEFGEKTVAVAGIKVEAPERVHPTGEVTIADAVDRMTANRPSFDAMRDDLERYDLSDSKFPHPFFGDMTAAEWLVVAGGHEMRHTMQIERILDRIRQ
ncbi:MAG: DinB family protein [Acidobacteriota bacterium]